MNKQQLAIKVWESANKMRAKIEANEYKDYILGFTYYKDILEVANEQQPVQHTTENSIRHVLETACRFAFPQKVLRSISTRTKLYQMTHVYSLYTKTCLIVELETNFGLPRIF